ncbi:MAG: sugar-binding domain-containing protein [Clostridium sp.]
MNISNEKIQKLIEIAKLYYEEDRTQSEIAKVYEVSRPLVSRMLKEAKELGIVNIEIRSPLEGNKTALSKLKNLFDLQGGIVVPNLSNDNLTNDALSKAALTYMMELKGNNYGIGWGQIIGNLVSIMEKEETMEGLAKSICPLVGNSSVGNRNYHSNELVRVFSMVSQASPIYLYAPAVVASEQELSIMRELENYKETFKGWSNMDTAIVNIGNYPSSPDFASVARYGDILKKKKAVGRILNYYLNVQGEILYSDADFAIQIPLQILKETKNIIGICASNINPKALAGALRTGMVTHLIAPEEAVKEVLELI